MDYIEEAIRELRQLVVNYTLIEVTKNPQDPSYSTELTSLYQQIATKRERILRNINAYNEHSPWKPDMDMMVHLKLLVNQAISSAQHVLLCNPKPPSQPSSSSTAATSTFHRLPPTFVGHHMVPSIPPQLPTSQPSSRIQPSTSSVLPSSSPSSSSSSSSTYLQALLPYASPSSAILLQQFTNKDGTYPSTRTNPAENTDPLIPPPLPLSSVTSHHPFQTVRTDNPNHPAPFTNDTILYHHPRTNNSSMHDDDISTVGPPSVPDEDDDYRTTNDSDDDENNDDEQTYSNPSNDNNIFHRALQHLHQQQKELRHQREQSIRTLRTSPSRFRPASLLSMPSNQAQSATTVAVTSVPPTITNNNNNNKEEENSHQPLSVLERDTIVQKLLNERRLKQQQPHRVPQQPYNPYPRMEQNLPPTVVEPPQMGEISYQIHNYSLPYPNHQHHHNHEIPPSVSLPSSAYVSQNSTMNSSTDKYIYDQTSDGNRRSNHPSISSSTSSSFSYPCTVDTNTVPVILSDDYIATCNDHLSVSSPPPTAKSNPSHHHDVFSSDYVQEMVRSAIKAAETVARLPSYDSYDRKNTNQRSKEDTSIPKTSSNDTVVSPHCVPSEPILVELSSSSSSANTDSSSDEQLSTNDDDSLWHNQHQDTIIYECENNNLEHSSKTVRKPVITNNTNEAMDPSRSAHPSESSSQSSVFPAEYSTVPPCTVPKTTTATSVSATEPSTILSSPPTVVRGSSLSLSTPLVSSVAVSPRITMAAGGQTLLYSSTFPNSHTRKRSLDAQKAAAERAAQWKAEQRAKQEALEHERNELQEKKKFMQWEEREKVRRYKERQQQCIKENPRTTSRSQSIESVTDTYERDKKYQNDKEGTEKGVDIADSSPYEPGVSINNTTNHGTNDGNNSSPRSTVRSPPTVPDASLVNVRTPSTVVTTPALPPRKPLPWQSSTTSNRTPSIETRTPSQPFAKDTIAHPVSSRTVPNSTRSIRSNCSNLSSTSTAVSVSSTTIEAQKRAAQRIKEAKAIAVAKAVAEEAKKAAMEATKWKDRNRRIAQFLARQQMATLVQNSTVVMESKVHDEDGSTNNVNESMDVAKGTVNGNRNYTVDNLPPPPPPPRMNSVTVSPKPSVRTVTSTNRTNLRSIYRRGSLVDPAAFLDQLSILSGIQPVYNDHQTIDNNDNGSSSSAVPDNRSRRDSVASVVSTRSRSLSSQTTNRPPVPLLTMKKETNVSHIPPPILPTAPKPFVHDNAKIVTNALRRLSLSHNPVPSLIEPRIDPDTTTNTTITNIFPSSMQPMDTSMNPNTSYYTTEILSNLTNCNDNLVKAIQTTSKLIHDSIGEDFQKDENLLMKKDEVALENQQNTVPSQSTAYESIKRLRTLLANVPGWTMDTPKEKDNSTVTTDPPSTVDTGPERNRTVYAVPSPLNDSLQIVGSINNGTTTVLPAIIEHSFMDSLSSSRSSDTSVPSEDKKRESSPTKLYGIDRLRKLGPNSPFKEATIRKEEDDRQVHGSKDDGVLNTSLPLPLSPTKSPSTSPYPYGIDRLRTVSSTGTTSTENHLPKGSNSTNDIGSVTKAANFLQMVRSRRTGTTIETNPLTSTVALHPSGILHRNEQQTEQDKPSILDISVNMLLPADVVNNTTSSTGF